MAVTEQSYTGNGSTTNYSFTFPYLKSTDVEVQVDATVTTAWTFANATTVQFNTAPSNGAKIRILRKTSVDNLTATFYAGSAIKSEDLNDNFTQNLYSTQEKSNRAFETTGGTITGNVALGEDVTVTFEGATDNAHETTLTVADPTADRTITIPNVTGTVVTTGDTGTVATAMIAAGAVTGSRIGNSEVNSEHFVTGAIDTAHIADAQVTTAKIAADAITGAKIADSEINSEHYVNGSIDNAHLSNDCINGDKIQDDVINSEHIVADSIDAEHYAPGSVDATALASNAVTQAKVADDAIGPDELASSAVVTASIVDNAVTLAKMADSSVGTSELVDSAVTAAKLATDAVTNAKVADSAIGTTELATNAVTTAKITDANVTTAKIAADAITAAKIADDVVNSEHIAAGAVDLEHMSANSVDSDQYVDGSIDSAHIANDQIDSQHYAAGSVDLEHMSANSVDSDQYVDGSIDRVHLAADIIDGTKIADDAIGAEHIAANAVTTSEIADAELTTLAGMQSGTASILAGGTALTATLSEINSVVDGKAPQTTITDDDTKYPTSGAVVDYVAAQIAPIGGLEVIATDAAFPNTQPASGVVISIADAGGLVVNGSGTSTTGRTVGGSTVTINNIASNFNSSTVDAGVCFQVSSTGSGQIYNYHKATLKEADLLNLSNDINDFAARYRVNAGEPGSNNDEGDLVYDTNANKMKVYDGSSWGEVTSTGDFKFLVPVDAGTTTAATWDGSDTSFDLKESTNSGSAAAITSVYQLMVSVNGIIQKPNTGSWSGSGEGFYLIDSDTIRFATAPPTGSSVFIIQFGSALSATTPADNTVATAKIQNGAVTLDKMASESVDEDNLKISNAGSNGQFLSKQSGNTGGLTWATVDTSTLMPLAGGTFTGDVTFDNATNAGKDLTWDMSDNALEFTDDTKAAFGNGADLLIYHENTGQTYIQNATGNLRIDADALRLRSYTTGEDYLKADANGSVELYYDNVKKLETNTDGIAISGNINIASGTFFCNDNGKLRLGGSQDLQIYFDGSNGIIDSVNETLHIMHGAEMQAKFIVDGAVELYNDNSKKFETTSGGVQVTGNMVADAVYLGDGEKLYCGTGDDLQIYHDAGGYNQIVAQNDHPIQIKTASENMIKAIPNGGVELYHNNVLKLQTTSAGGTLTGTWTGAGKVLQVKKATLGSDFNSGSTSWTNVGLSETITLASTSNYIYVILSTTPYIGGGSEERFRLNILCTPSGGSEASIMEDNYWAYRTSDDWKSSSGHHDAYYHPNSTAELTINVKAVRQSGGDNLWLGRHATDANTNTLTIMEIAG